MATSNLRKMISSLLLLPLIIGCNNTTNDNKIEHLKSLQNDFGFIFYDSFDMYTLKGINEVDLSNQNYPFVAVRRDSNSIDIHHFVSEIQTSYSKYKKVKDYYISTKIIPEETQNNYYKEVLIYYVDRELLYSYTIYDNFEKLEGLTFKYKNGERNEYVNMNDCYYHYSDTVSEKSVLVLYPTLQKE